MQTIKMYHTLEAFTALEKLREDKVSDQDLTFNNLMYEAYYQLIFCHTLVTKDIQVEIKKDLLVDYMLNTTNPFFEQYFGHNADEINEIPNDCFKRYFVREIDHAIEKLELRNMGLIARLKK